MLLQMSECATSQPKYVPNMCYQPRKDLAKKHVKGEDPGFAGGHLGGRPTIRVLLRGGGGHGGLWGGTQPETLSFDEAFFFTCNK